MQKLAVWIVAISAAVAMTLPAAGQEADIDGRISGTVVTERTGNPLQGATVEIRRAADSTFVTGAITSEDGAFEIMDLPEGTYHARVSFVGFAAHVARDLAITPSERVHDLGKIALEESAAHLDQVEVAGERAAVEVRVDRTVYNVDDFFTAAGGSARDVLAELPSIEIDLEGAISYRGNQSVAIHIDGRPAALTGDALISFLQSLPANAVERVEMIPAPSARYEPDGMAGIINIVLARNRDAGWSGGLTVGAATGLSYNVSPSLGYHSGPWSFFSTYGLRNEKHDLSRTRLLETHSHNPASLLEQATYEEHIHLSHALTNQLEYRIGEASALSLSTVFSMRDNDMDNRTNMAQGYMEGENLERQIRLERNQSTPHRMDLRLSFDHMVNGNDDHTLDAHVRYQYNEQDREALNNLHVQATDGTPDELLLEQTDALLRQTRRGVLEVDYDRPLGALDLEAGYQGSLRRVESGRTFETLVNNGGAAPDLHENRFAHDEHIQAAYGIGTLDRGPIGVKAGLRAEQAWTDFHQATTGERFENNYFSLFPSAFFTYNMNDVRQIQLSYSKRISRPSLWQLNPLNTSTDPTYRRTGNPHLEPQYTHAFELGLTQHWSAVTLRVSPFFRHTVNRIEAYETLDADGVSLMTFANASSSNSYGAEVVATLQIAPLLSGNVSVNAHRIVTEGGNVSGMLNNDALALSSRANLTLTLRPGTSFQMTQMYRSPRNIPGGRMAGNLSATLTFRQQVLNGQGNISLQARDIFDTMETRFRRTTDSFYHELHHNMNARRLMLTFQYTFGQQDRQHRVPDAGGDMH